jgi:hypothetical protein
MRSAQPCMSRLQRVRCAQAQPPGEASPLVDSVLAGALKDLIDAQVELK